MSTVLFWILRVALTLVFLGAGLTKLMGDAASVEMFDVIGAGQWMRLFVGAAEVAGAVGLLIPRLHVLAAAGLALVMLGATVFNLTSLAANPVPTIVLMLLALVVVWAGRRRTRLRADPAPGRDGGCSPEPISPVEPSTSSHRDGWTLDGPTRSTGRAPSSRPSTSSGR